MKCRLRFLQPTTSGLNVVASLPSASLRVPFNNQSTSRPYKYPHRHQKVSPDAHQEMSKPKQHEYAMTLRLQQAMADEIEDIAYTLNLTRAAFVRRSIRRGIEHARRHELPLLNKRVLEAIRP
jgi:hypothetical protein